MVRKLHVDVRLATQVLVLQVAVVTLTLGIAGGLIAYMSHQRLAAQYEDRSLDMARAIAFAPLVRADVAGDGGHALPQLLGRRREDILPATGDHDLRAAAAELGSGLPAEAGTAAGDECDLPREEPVGEDL